MNQDLSKLRQEYHLDELTEDKVHKDPFEQFKLWFKDAESCGIIEPNAMTLATVDSGGNPHARIVLLKGLDHGLIFYTNYESNKGREIASKDRVALLFFWDALQRQVRIEGNVERVDEAMSDAYFKTRPLSSQIGAIASPQSRVLSGRQELEDAEAVVRAKIADSKPDRPKNWGGFRVIPHYFEFWQGRRSRLHDRLVFNLQAQNEWTLKRLAP